MITADSSVWIAYFTGDDTPATRLLDAALDDSSSELVVLDLVLMEVLRGFRHERDWQVAKDLFEPLPLLSAGGRSVALRAAAIYRELRARGTTVRSAIDLMVGAWCMESGCALLHADRDFIHMRGLPSWSAAPDPRSH